MYDQLGAQVKEGFASASIFGGHLVGNPRAAWMKPRKEGANRRAATPASGREIEPNSTLEFPLTIQKFKKRHFQCRILQKSQVSLKSAFSFTAQH